MANPLPVEDSLKEERVAERERQRRLVASLPRTSEEKILLAGVCSQLLDAQFRAEESLIAVKSIEIPADAAEDVARGLSAMGMYCISCYFVVDYPYFVVFPWQLSSLWTLIWICSRACIELSTRLLMSQMCVHPPDKSILVFRSVSGFDYICIMI